MAAFDADTFKMKLNIASVAVSLYSKQDGHFLMRDIAAELDIDPAEIFDYFPNKNAILQFYYASLITRYRAMTDDIDDFESYTLSEKFSNFAFTIFDMMQERQAFVESTFESIIADCHCKTDFEKELEQLVEQFLVADSHLSVGATATLNSCFYRFLSRQFIEVCRFWLNDDSENKELSMEFIDKLTSFLQELLYNSIIDKGISLVRFAASNRKQFISNIPLVNKFCSTFEIR